MAGRCPARSIFEIRQLIQGLVGVRVERYEKHNSYPQGEAIPCLRLRFADQALLEMSEAILYTAEC